ncbi:DMT family transporter [Buchnera aphidicola (Ceratoglyphina bambusae)]|uniref:DMT family transporter n=1 Tax=Buchnera aphidicola TaxID=9 RepID=UPI0031B88A86
MNKIIILFIFLIVSITWSTTWVAMKIAIETIPPFFATGLRFLLSFPILYILSYFTNTPLLFPKKNRFFQILIILFYFSIPFSLILYSSNYINTSVSSIIFSTTPIFILFLSKLILKNKINFYQILGSLITILSIFFLILLEYKNLYYNSIKGVILLLLALISHSYIYIECKKREFNISALTFNAIPSFISGILITLISLIIEKPKFYNFSKNSIFAILYLSNFSSIFGILLYFYLQKIVSKFFSSAVFLIFPIFSIFIELYFYNSNIFNIKFFIFYFFALFGILITLIFSIEKTNKK